MTTEALPEHIAGEPELAPHPGSRNMPRWTLAELVDAPRFGWRNWTAMVGPGLLMGGAAIGGGEWLMGPTVTAKFGGGLMWLATLSILGQLIYNLEISRYTLYCGEPIFTGKFRTLPGPMFWLGVYLLLDIGSIFPYLAGSAATPLAAVILQRMPDPAIDKTLLQWLSYGIFLGAMLPMVFGGKIYNALRSIMMFKIVIVMGFLILVGVAYSRVDTWTEIFSGFFKFGNVPIKRAEDFNNNGRLDPGEDWDSDGHLDVVEPELTRSPPLDTDGDQIGDSWPAFNGGSQPVRFLPVTRQTGKKTAKFYAPDVDGDGQPDATVRLGSSSGVREIVLDSTNGKPLKFLDLDGDGCLDGDNLDNYFAAAFAGRPFPTMDFAMIGFLSALVAISGSGGLSNTPISNFTRDQGWGMGHHVGAIPSMIGGQNLQLSHEGAVFAITPESLGRWRRWYRHVLRDQLVVWVPACFLGIALPSMLSVQFLPRGFQVENQWEAAGMTAGAVQEQIGGTIGQMCWFMTLFCGFLVLSTSLASTVDGVIRRWVDVFWTASGTLRKLDTRAIRYVYFAVLTVYSVFGIFMLTWGEPQTLLLIATTIFNFALGFSCWHTLWLNHVLLPRECRPGRFASTMLFLAGLFFWTMATIAAIQKLRG